MTTDFGDLDFSDFGLPNFGLKSNANGAGLESATKRTEGRVRFDEGGGIFLPGDPVSAEGWLAGELASLKPLTLVPGTFAEDGSFAGGALDPVGERVGVSVVIFVVTSQVEDGPVSCSWGTEESCFKQTLCVCSFQRSR